MKKQKFFDQLNLLDGLQQGETYTVIETANPDMDRMKELVSILKEAAYVYEQEDREIMSNLEYDQLYDELVALEKKTGVILSGSVTQKVGYEVSSKLEKVMHESKMLSLDKTKDVSRLESFLGDQEGFLSTKMDGLTVVVTYDKGKLVSAVTRGNGEQGERIDRNYLNFINVPKNISYTEKLVIRGEAIISYSSFEKINEQLADGEKYKNPRNLCSGSVRQLDPNVTAQRNVEFFAFTIVEGFPTSALKTEKLEKVKSLGFSIVEYIKVNKSSIQEAVKVFADKISTFNIPSDGLVLTMDDIAYSESLGTTSKFPRDAIAYKWQDELKETKLIKIEWSASRTGALNPVAIFETVDLEGTDVSRASVHNLSIVKSLKLGEGDRILVYKANLIIPQIGKNLTNSNTCIIPDVCPVCGEKTEIKVTQSKSSEETEVLMCSNPNCIAKHTGLLEHFVGRDAANIEGLSSATLEKFVELGLIHDLSSIYSLKDHAEFITHLEGFGKKSVANLIHAIDKSRNIDMPNFLYALGITQVGRTASKAICKHFGYDFNRIMSATVDELTSIADIGPITANELVEYMKNEKNVSVINKLLKEVTFNPVSIESEILESPIKGLTFVVTGDVFKFKNRKELSNKIEALGGKVTGSVSKKTDYLINNDITSESGKNKKAKEVNEAEGREVVKIIDEEQFLALIGE